MKPDSATPSRWPARISWLLAGVFLVLLLQLALMAMRGGRWSFLGFSAGNPRDRLWAAGAVLLAWLALHTWRRRERWTAFAGRVVMLAASLGMTWWVAEQCTRAWLRQRQGFGALSALQEAHPEKNYRVHEQHALVRIVRLSPNKNLVYELRPKLSLNFGRSRCRTNRMGMRDSKEYEPAKPAHTVRMVGIGDLGMFGWAVHQDEDYLSVLEQRLAGQTNGLAYEVLNFGVPGYNTHQEVEMLIDRGLQFSPDVVLLAWAVNDFDLPFFLHAYRDYREKGVSYLYAYLFERDRFLDLTRPAVTGSYKFSDKLADPAVAAMSGRDGVARSLGRLKELGAQHRFQILVFGPMDPVSMQLCRDLGLAYLNTYEAIPRGSVPKEWAIHFIHPRKEGHALIAEHLERELDRRGWLTPSPAGG